MVKRHSSILASLLIFYNMVKCPKHIISLSKDAVFHAPLLFSDCECECLFLSFFLRRSDIKIPICFALYTRNKLKITEV